MARLKIEVDIPKSESRAQELHWAGVALNHVRQAFSDPHAIANQTTEIPGAASHMNGASMVRHVLGFFTYETDQSA